MCIGENIAKIRKNHRLSQAELAEKLGVSEEKISEWERNQELPDVKMISLLSDIFHVSADEIIKETPCFNIRKNINPMIKWKFIYSCVFSLLLWVSAVVFKLSDCVPLADILGIASLGWFAANMLFFRKKQVFDN